MPQKEKKEMKRIVLLESDYSDDYVNESEDEEEDDDDNGDGEESHLEKFLTEQELEELLADLLEVESKAAEAQEALEEESIVKVEADVRKELAQSLSGDELEKAVVEEMLAFNDQWEVELETESAHLRRELFSIGELEENLQDVFTTGDDGTIEDDSKHIKQANSMHELSTDCDKERATKKYDTSEIVIISSSDSGSNDSDAVSNVSASTRRRQKIRRIFDDAELGDETKNKIAIEMERQERLISLGGWSSSKSVMVSNGLSYDNSNPGRRRFRSHNQLAERGR